MPVNSYWTAEDKIPISQKKVSIQAENGLQYSLGQEINFTIPAGTGYMMPSETYLRMDVTLKNPNTTSGSQTALQLDSLLGGNVLIRDIRVSSGGAQNVLLEELQNVNILTALKYDYETNDDLKRRRALTEGAVAFDPACRGTEGCREDVSANGFTNPYFDNDSANFNGTTSYKQVKCLLRLPTGIFQNDKIFPLQMTGGLRIQIILEDPAKVFRQLSTVTRNENLVSNPVFHGKDAAGSAWGKGTPTSTIFLGRDNTVTSVENCPFVKGQTIFFQSNTNASTTEGSTEFVITGVSVDSNLIKLTGASASNNESFDLDSDAFVVCGKMPTTFEPTATIDNVELIVQKVEMPQGYTAKLDSMLKSGGAMNYDFLSYTNFKYSQLASDQVVNIRLPIQFSRCKSILCIPTDATGYTTSQSLNASETYLYNKLASDCHALHNKSTRSGLVGIADRASDYQFIYDGKLNPNRKVPLARISLADTKAPLNQQVLIEQEKALRQANIEPLSFDAYQRNFFIGRALSLSNGVYDARGKDFNLQVEYHEPAGGPTKPHLWNNWVSHLRRIVVRGDSISLEV
tara:strand:- start:8627 stop:10345 length:1719 start_codon:yes stop_codon:yes gene_type:complete